MDCVFQKLDGTNKYECLNCGFITPPLRTAKIHRKCTPGSERRKKPLAVAAKAVRYLSAIERWRLAGKPERTDDEVRDILETHCVGCELFDGAACTHVACGCRIKSPEQEQESWLGRNVHRAMVNKLRMATERCPIGKWHAAGPRRICFATPIWAVGGVERWFLDLCKWLPKEAKMVRLVVTDPRGISFDADKWLPPDVELVHSERVVDDGGYDVLFTWGHVELAKVIAGVSVPVVDIQHGVSGEPWQKHMAEQAAALSRTKGITLVAVNEQSLLNFSEADRNLVKVIPNGADQDRVKQKGPLVFTRDENARYAVYIGRISPEKNVQALIDAVNLLGDPWRAVIVGPSHLQLSSVTERVHVVGPSKTIGQYLELADVFVHPSYFEAHGLAINEAWLAGVPVVSCDYPVNKQFHELHGEMMWLVQVRPSHWQLADAIVSASKSDPRVEHARRVAEQHYTAARMAERWCELVLSCTGHNAGKSSQR